MVSMSQEIDALTKQEANMIIEEIKQVVPGQVRQKLHLFTPASVPNLAEFRMVPSPLNNYRDRVCKSIEMTGVYPTILKCPDLGPDSY